MQSKERSALVDSNAGKERLASYIYEYLVHIGAPQAAQTFLKEINWKKDIALGDPPGFLHAWWSVFWDLYSAAPERRETYSSSNEAKAYHDYGFASSHYLIRSHDSEAPNFRPLKPHNTPSVCGTNSFPRPPLSPSLRPPFRSLSFNPSYPCNSRSVIRPQGEFNMQKHMPPNMTNPPTNYNKDPSSSFRLRPPTSFADLGKYYEGNYRFPPPYPSGSLRPNQSYSGMSLGGNQPTQGNRESSSEVNFLPRNYIDTPRQERPPGQSKLHDFTTCNQDFAYTNQRPVSGPNCSDFLRNYRSSSPVPAQKPRDESDLKHLKGSPLSESDDYAEFSDFSLADYRRFIDGDNAETEAILKIKESMQEEAKKFEKASEPPTSYIQLP